SEFAAKYLPQLVNQFHTSEGPVNTAMTLLNNISDTSYFLRYLRLPEAQTLVNIQARRTVLSSDSVDSFRYDDLGAAFQFLFTLVLLQGPHCMTEADKYALIVKAKHWYTVYRGTGYQIEGSCIRLFGYLENDE
ncbi:hypothetical protein AMATHDRAFT_152229, partial [Amanita thiersii Skay4041]